MINYLIGIIVALLGAFVYQKNKADTATARNQNLDVKEDLLKTDSKIADNNAELKVEENKQADLKKEIDTAKLENTISSIVDYLNNRNKK